MEQNNTTGTPLPVVTAPTVKDIPTLYGSPELRAMAAKVLSNPALFPPHINAEFEPTYCPEGEEGQRYFAAFTQVYNVKKTEDLKKPSRPVLHQVTTTRVAQIPKGGEITEDMELITTDEKGVKLYSPKVLKVVVRWKAKRFEPVSNFIRTEKAIAVSFFAPKGLGETKIAVYAINTLAIVCENKKVNGRAIPVRTSAGINLAFHSGKKEVNTGLLGEGIRAGLMNANW